MKSPTKQRLPRQDAADRLLTAVTTFVKARGGSVFVVGPIELVQWPDEPSSKFSVNVRCLGKRPRKADRDGGR